MPILFKKRHYEALAAVINREYRKQRQACLDPLPAICPDDGSDWAEVNGLLSIIKPLSDAFALDNPNFDCSLFREQCTELEPKTPT